MKLILLLLGCLSFMSAACADGGVIKGPGTFSFESGDNCAAILKKSEKGGFLKLLLDSDHKHAMQVADDVTAIVWISPKLLAYSTSPIYGKPGIFVVACSDSSVSKLVAPKTIDSSYPDGADYFEIQSADENQIKYYYGPDVDKIDFAQFRTDKNLRVVNVPKSIP